jgi:hypothetical protein
MEVDQLRFEALENIYILEKNIFFEFFVPVNKQIEERKKQ